jgi:hypothetical protein
MLTDHQVIELLNIDRQPEIVMQSGDRFSEGRIVRVDGGIQTVGATLTSPNGDRRFNLTAFLAFESIAEMIGQPNGGNNIRVGA